jgi:hypothetical protein
VYFYRLYATLTVAEKDRNMSEVYRTLFTTACNYTRTQVVGMCVETLLTARDMNNFKTRRKIVFLQHFSSETQRTSCTSHPAPDLHDSTEALY